MSDTDVTHSYTDAYGIRIHYRRWLAASPRAVVQIAHGVGEHSGRYRRVAAALVDAGYSVYADDHRGHGLTGREQNSGDVSQQGRLGPGGLRATADAVHQFTEVIAAESPGLPIVLLGHSWGSFLAQMIVNSHARDYDALVLSGSSLRLPGWLNSGDLNKRWRGPAAHGLEWLSRESSVWQEFRDDPLTFEETLQDRFGVLDTLRLAGIPGRRLERDLPSYLVVGADDPVGGPRAVEALARVYRRRSRLTDVTVRVYPQARHELFNESNRDEVIADLIAWLDGHLPARVSGEGEQGPARASE
ncbi:alpha/beta fold hydrolase [Microbacteriaceae bacterium VKM Ac-2855]|nr:alpha/beta fold hydrolase [Microbacteriaceae bacterium VKM Ac-2855]